MKGFTLIELAIVIVIAALLAAVAVPIYNGIVKDSKWTEAKTAIGAIKAAMDTYSAKSGGDLLTEFGVSGSFYTGGAAVNGTSGTALLTLIRVEESSITNLQYFDPEDFTYTVADASPDTYTIVCTAVTGTNGGASGNGPTTGTVTYASTTGDWTENY